MCSGYDYQKIQERPSVGLGCCYTINIPSKVDSCSFYHKSIAQLYPYWTADICGEAFFDTYPLQLSTRQVFYDLSSNLNLYIFIQFRHHDTLIMKSSSEEPQQYKMD